MKKAHIYEIYSHQNKKTHICIEWKPNEVITHIVQHYYS